MLDESTNPVANRGQCAICYRIMPLTRAGLVHVHGPVGNRCRGSCNLPLIPNLGQGELSPGIGASPPSSPPTREVLNAPRSTVKILKRIPRASRDHTARKLATILDQVVLSNNTASWDHLFSFAPHCLRVQRRGGHRRSLASHVNAMLREESDPDPPDSIPEERSHRQHCGQGPQDPLQNLAARVAAKLEEGDIKGAIRLPSSEDTIASSNPGTLSAMQEKHLPSKSSPGSRGDHSPVVSIAPPIQVLSEEVVKAICSFPCGSTGGFGGLWPQHLKDMIRISAGE